MFDVWLTLSKGSFNVLLGATLAGKTSLMRLLAGLARLSAEAYLSRRNNIARTSGGVAPPDQHQEDARSTEALDPARSVA